MYVSDDVVWESVLFLASFFTVLGAYFPLRVPEGQETGPGLVWGYLRAVIFPFLAGATWYLLSAMSVSLNNCIASFGVCFTSPTFAATTATITTGQFDYPLYLFFEGLAVSWFIIGSALAFYLAFWSLLRKPTTPD